MEGGRGEIEEQIERILHRIERIEQRLETLETPARSGSTHRLAHTARTQPAAATREPQTRATAPLALIGRTLVILGGAFLLRAFTESGVLPQAVGTSIALLYALYWFSRADRGARANSASATFHGLTAVLIAFPLLWEATSKFGLLSPAVGAAALLAVSGIGLAIAWRREFESVAWLTVLGGLVTCWALAFATRAFAPFVDVVVLVGLATLWMAYLRDQRGLGFFSGLVANLSVLLLSVTLFLGQRAEAEPVIGHGSLLLLQLGLFVGYLSSIAGRILLTKRNISILESMQALSVFVIGLGGAVALVRITGEFQPLLGALSLVLAVVCYAASFRVIDRRRGRRRNFIFFSTAALVLTLVGLGALFAGTALAIAFAIVALITAWLGSWKSRATLSGHGAFYIAAAATFSGLLRDSLLVFVDLGAPADRWLTLPTAIIVTVATICVWLPVAAHGRTWGRLTRLPKLVVLSVLLCLIAALAMSTLTAMLLGSDDPNAATAAALRTAVVAGAAVVLGWLGRTREFPEAVWVLYAVLALGAVKLLLEDMRVGQPATQFVSLILYGGALILAPRLARRDPSTKAQVADTGA